MGNGLKVDLTIATRLNVICLGLLVILRLDFDHFD